MLTQSLTVGAWYQLTKLDPPTSLAFFEIVGTGVCIAAVDTVTPASGSVGYSLVQGFNGVPLPDDKNLYIKLVSGTASVTYSQFSGLEMDVTKCGYGRGDGAAINEWNINSDAQAGFDDAASPDITAAAYLTTGAAGLASGATINSAWLSLRFSTFFFGRSFTVKAYKYNVDKTPTFTNYTAMNSSLTFTTATASFTVDNSGRAVVDVDAIVTELVAIGGWTVASPIQFHISDSGSHSGTSNKSLTIVRTPGTSLLVT